MTKYVVDASVAIKWYVPEVDEAAARSLLAVGFDLHVPELFYPEIGNILWKKVTRGLLKPEDARATASAIKDLPLSIHPSPPLLEPAIELALSHGRTVYDAYYLALSFDLACPFVTADERLVNSLQPMFGNQIRLVSTLK